MRMVLLGDAMSADQALAAGLVNDVVETEDVLQTARSMARRLIARAPLAVTQAKASINASLMTTLSLHYALERQAFAITLDSDDKSEGVKAFKEKRPAIWRGR